MLWQVPMPKHVQKEISLKFEIIPTAGLDIQDNGDFIAWNCEDWYSGNVWEEHSTPLKAGKSKVVIAHNIAIEIKAGKTNDQAVAIAKRKVSATKKKGY